MKKRGFGVGKWNGVGGKVAGEETTEEAALRELKEEIGVDAEKHNLEKVGNIKFFFNNKPDFNQQMHIFFVNDWQGEPKESEEMSPAWYMHENIPYHAMWVDDSHWLPKVISGKKIEGEFHFNETGDKIEKFELNEI